MKLRKRQLVLLTVAILLLVLGLAATLHHLRAKHSLADYQKQLIAAGEKLTVEELIPKPIPEEQNGANIFFRASTLMNVSQGVFQTNPPTSMMMVAPGKARVGWAQSNIRSREATNEWTDAIAIANDLAPVLSALEELIDRPNLDFNVNYGMGFSAPLPNLAQTKGVALKLNYAALCDLHRGDAASATRHLRALLAVSHGLADERLIISQLVRIAVTAIGAAGTWEVLQSPAITDEQLAQLHEDWNRLEFTIAAENALAMERAMSQMTVEQMRESSAEFRKMVSGFAWPAAAPAATGGDWFDQAEQFAKDTWDKGRLKAKETAWRFSWSYTDQLRAMKSQQVLIDCARESRTNGSFGLAISVQKQRWEALGLEDIETDDIIVPADANVRTMFSQSTLALNKFINKVMVIEANRQFVVTAIALQRHKLRHGNYPAQLAALVPDFLPTLPHDPVDGQPLRYKQKPDGTFLLYSVGEDGEDNSGDPKPAKEGSKSFAWQRGRDWVWPQPATQQEIENYFMNRSK